MTTKTVPQTTVPLFQTPVNWLQRIHHLFTGYSSNNADLTMHAGHRPDNALGNLPIEDKLRLGLYRYMD